MFMNLVQILLPKSQAQGSSSSGEFPAESSDRRGSKDTH